MKNNLASIREVTKGLCSREGAPWCRGYSVGKAPKKHCGKPWFGGEEVFLVVNCCEGEWYSHPTFCFIEKM
jgi:hypothetical protein